MLDVSDVGRRVSVRRRVEGGLTDVVGHLLEVSPASWTVLRASGEVVAVDPGAVTAAKVVPGAPVRPGRAVPELSPGQLQRICGAGWPARETSSIGDWSVRAHDGITGRANSTLAVGDPGCALEDALERVGAFYAGRSLPPLLQLPLVDRANLALADLGWERLHTTVVQVAPITYVVGAAGSHFARDDLRAVVEPVPSSDWRALMHDLDTGDPRSHLAILTGPPVVGFATLHRDGEPVAIGRVSVEGEWAGITSVDVAPHARREGLGREVMRTLLGWAEGRGARWTYLQVRSYNDAALRMYARLGYVTHHPYCYRSRA